MLGKNVECVKTLRDLVDLQNFW